MAVDLLKQNNILSNFGSSLFYYTSARHDRNIATRVQQEQHECNIGETRLTQALNEGHECDISEKCWFW